VERGNLAVGQADKPLRDFSLALLSSIDVDSRLRRRKAPGGASASIPLLRPSHLSLPSLIVSAKRPARFYDSFADLPIRQIHKLLRFHRGTARLGAGYAGGFLKVREIT